VDRYKMAVYKSLVGSFESNVAANVHHAREAPYLVGFSCGNARHEGCLTLDENVRIHSCEKGTPCCVMQTRLVVWIQPIVAHLPSGHDVTEVGLGGGGDDLEQEMEVRHMKPNDLEFLKEVICLLFSPVLGSRLHFRIDELQDLPAGLRNQIKTLLSALLNVDSSSQDAAARFVDNLSEDTLNRLESTIGPLVKSAMISEEKIKEIPKARSLPSRIRFPYARHSSCPELRHLIESFRPADIWPCTVDIAHWQEPGITIEGLFGACCKGSSSVHDQLAIQLATARKRGRGADGGGSQETGPTSTYGASSLAKASRALLHIDNPREITNLPELEEPPCVPTIAEVEAATCCKPISKGVYENAHGQISSAKRPYEFVDDENGSRDNDRDRIFRALDLQMDSQASTLTERAYETRLDAFRTTVQNNEGAEWRPIGLISTTDNHSKLDEELGSG
jgi:DNA cross-link repair 1C protein